jgi:methionine synthase II (cobalamin-independent)
MIAYHADHIGSLLRPSELIPAREEAGAGRISRARFKTVEDRAVEDAIRLQVTGGLSEGFVSQLQCSLNLAGKRRVDHTRVRGAP